MTHKVSKYDFTASDRSDRVWQVIEDHRPQSEIYAVKYGGLIIAVPTAFSSFVCQRYFNKRFKLGRSLFTYVPMLVPAIGSGLIHKTVTEEDILYENMRCVGCTEFKSASIQFFSGMFWSLILSPLSSCMIGSLQKTVYVPPIHQYPLETLKLVGKHLSRFAPTAVALILGNFAFTLALTNLEVRQYQTLKLRMLIRLSNFDSEVTPAEFGEFSS